MLVTSKFAPGQLVVHRKFGYRGVIVDVDPVFSGSEQWYEHMARSRPPKDAPWYRVLVHEAEHQTYVAERHLSLDPEPVPINHPELAEFFVELSDGVYVTAGSRWPN